MPPAWSREHQVASKGWVSLTATFPARHGWGLKQQEEVHMAWKTPVIVEIALGAEINSYACASRK